VDAREIVGSQRHVQRAHVLLQVTPTLGAGNRNDIVSTREHPRERQLARRTVIVCRQLPYLLYERQVALEVVALEAWGHAAVVVGGEVLELGDLPGEEAAAERAVGDEADAEVAAGGEHAV